VVEDCRQGRSRDRNGSQWRSATSLGRGQTGRSPRGGEQPREYHDSCAHRCHFDRYDHTGYHQGPGVHRLEHVALGLSQHGCPRLRAVGFDNEHNQQSSGSGHYFDRHCFENLALRSDCRPGREDCCREHRGHDANCTNHGRPVRRRAAARSVRQCVPDHLVGTGGYNISVDAGGEQLSHDQCRGHHFYYNDDQRSRDFERAVCFEPKFLSRSLRHADCAKHHQQRPRDQLFAERSTCLGRCQRSTVPPRRDKHVPGNFGKLRSRHATRQHDHQHRRAEQLSADRHTVSLGAAGKITSSP
jgi:hypothetical protein